MEPGREIENTIYNRDPPTFDTDTADNCHQAAAGWTHCSTAVDMRGAQRVTTTLLSAVSCSPLRTAAAADRQNISSKFYSLLAGSSANTNNKTLINDCSICHLLLSLSFILLQYQAAVLQAGLLTSAGGHLSFLLRNRTGL